MLDQYISNSSYLEFPSFAVAVFTLLLALVLSTTIAMTYKWTYQGEKFPNNFFQAMVMSSTVAAMVMMAVGDNLAVGFGVMGAVSIIRFRTLIKNPRNIIFMFASLSIGIATGVFGYAIAISGTVIFSITVFLLYLSPYGKESEQKFELAFTVLDANALQSLKSQLDAQDLKYANQRMRRTETGIRYIYHINLGIDVDHYSFYENINNLEGISNVRIEVKDNDDQL